ncbi:hypothetical protein [Galbibacter sp. BG1]
MTAKNATVGNYMLERINNGNFLLHWLGDGWSSVERTEQQVEESKTFFDLWNNY